MKTKEEQFFDKRIERAVIYCEENGFEKNEHGVYIYKSDNGHSSMNLPCILQNYADEVLVEEIQIKKDMQESVNQDGDDPDKNIDFDINTLNDQMKYDFIVENFHKIDLSKLEKSV